MFLVWLFKEYRDLYVRSLELEQRIVEISTKAEQQIRDLQQNYHDQVVRSDKQIADLEEQLTKRPTLDVTALAEELFQDRPYDDGRIPDHAWLTPGQPDRASK